MLRCLTKARNLIRLGVLVGSVPLFAGCEPSADANEWSVTVDTLAGGVLHVINTPPSGEPAPGWHLEEELRIGTIDGGGPASFGELMGLVVTEEGHIAVLDGLAQEVRVFDDEGQHLATHGGQGGGPGEFQGAYGLMLSPDGTLWVPDHRNDRMSVLDPTQGFETSYRLPILSRAFVWRGVMMADGCVMKPSITLGPPRRSLWRVWGPDMTQVDSILIPEGPPVDREDPPGSFYWEAPDGRSSGYMGVPFYAQGQLLLDPYGTFWLAPSGDPSYRITASTIEGDTTLIFETRRAPVLIPSEVRDSAIDAVREVLVARGGGSQDWDKVPAVRAAIEDVFTAAEDRIWVQTANDSWARYDVYDRSGRYVRSVDTSYRILSWLRPIVRGDYFWAVVVDDLNVHYVVRARIVGVSGVQDG